LPDPSDLLLIPLNSSGDLKKFSIFDSHGTQKRLAWAAAVIHGPRILFLDEPFEGVDALAAGALNRLLG
jgi:ABC-2 type transport system ATP-binding protein